MDALDLVTSFNDCITRSDLVGLGEFISDDHVFTDSAGGEVRGRLAVLEAWRGFFSSFPDYENLFDRTIVDGAFVYAIGRSRCSDARLDGSALWRAEIRDGKICHWWVLDDTPENRAKIGAAG